MDATHNRKIMDTTVKMRLRSLWKEPDSFKIRKYSTNSAKIVKSHFDQHSKRSNIDLGLNIDKETMENQSGLTF